MNTRPSVLLIDDSEGDLLLFRRLIRLKASDRFGDVFQALNGEQALGMFVDLEHSIARLGPGFPPAIIFVDINMPRMNGFEFLRAFEGLQRERHELAHIKAVVLSSSELQSDREQAAGFSIVRQYLVKPLRAAALIAVADQLKSAA